jgi:tetratricopeptide (TPR) repeat protein
MDTAKGSDDSIRMKIRFEDLLLLAESRFAEKDYQTAQSLLDEAKELGSSEDPKVLFYEASILQAKGDVQRAAKYFNRAGLSPGLDAD